jgi:hypothetical protein
VLGSNRAKAARGLRQPVVAVDRIPAKYTNRSAMANGILSREINQASDKGFVPKHVAIAVAGPQQPVAKKD